MQENRMALLPWLDELHQENPILQLTSHTLGENVTVAKAERSCVLLAFHRLVSPYHP
jgi:hypothetical protein